MSTLVSADLPWEKSSTRRYAPPGGESSISLGDYVTPTPNRPNSANGSTIGMASPTRGSPKASPLSSPSVPAIVTSVGVRVGVAVCEASGLKLTTVSALQKMGIKSTVYEVSDPLQLPFAAKCLVTNARVSVVVVIGFLVEDAHWCSSEVAGALVKTLLDLSLELKVPIVNGLCFSQVSFGEMTALSHKLAVAATDMAAMNEGDKESYTVSRIAAPSSPFGATTRNLALKSRKSSVFQPPRSMPQDLSSLLLGLRTSLVAHGVKGMFQLGRRFRLSDTDESGDINFHEFQVCMRDAHMDWIEDELKNVFEHFSSGSGGISYNDFLLAVRGEVPTRRAQLILEAFQVMDKDKSGVINAQDLKGTYDASKHPDVQNKGRSAEDVMEEFLSTFEGEVKDGKVTPEEWCRYYALISAGMDSDDEFELMMRNAWRLSGGKGALANTTSRRVLATRADGTQTVEEVKGGMTIDATDTRAMLGSLRAQGLNVTAVETFGCLDTTEPTAIAENSVDLAETHSVGVRSSEGSTFAPPVRQGPGGNSSLVLG